LIVLLPLLFISTYLFIDYGKIVNEITQMALGRLPVNEEFTLLSGAINITAISVFAIGLALATLIVVIPMAGHPRREPGFASLKGVHIVVFLEELLARGLLFWLPLYLSGYNIIVFYVFWILSNGIWALLHLTNYEESERSLWLVLPQFIGGLFIESYAFLKFGFWVAYAIHLFYDFILFSTIGHEELKSSFIRNLPSRVAGIGLGALLIGVSSVSFSTFSSLVIQLPYIQWLNGNFIAENITMFTFVGFLLIMGNIINFICDLSGMDERSVLDIIKQREYGFFEKRLGWIALSALGGLLVPIFLGIIYYLTIWISIPILNFFTPFKNITNATFLLCAFIMSSFVGIGGKEKTTSPSAEFRSFLVNLPIYFLLFAYMRMVPILDFFLCTIVYFTISGVIDSLRLY
jgi:hypothetical protein